MEDNGVFEGGTYQESGIEGEESESYSEGSDITSEDADTGEEEKNDAYVRRKRRRIQEDDEGADDESDTDVSIQLIGERDVPGDDEEDLELLRALDESQPSGPGDTASRPIEPGANGPPSDRVSSSGGGLEVKLNQAISKQEPIDLETELIEQQVVEVPESELPDEASAATPIVHKPVRDYRCPICFEPPDTAVMTPCGHIFCVACLFQMVNSSRTHRRSGHCALCRSEVKLRDIRMVVLRKKRVQKES